MNAGSPTSAGPRPSAASGSRRPVDACAEGTGSRCASVDSALSRVAFSVLTRRSTGARAAIACISGTNAASPSTATSEDASQSGKSPCTCVGASASVRVPSACRSASSSGAGAWPSPVHNAAIPSASIPRATASAPSRRARGVSASMIQVADARRRNASKTSAAIAARSFEPAKRCDRPQSLSASGAGRCRVSMSARISIPAASRPPGVTRSPCRRTRRGRSAATSARWHWPSRGKVDRAASRYCRRCGRRRARCDRL